MRKRLLASVAATALLAGVVAANAQRGPEAGERSPAASSQSQPSSGSERRGGSAASPSQQDRGGQKSGQSAPANPRSTTGAGSTEDRKGDRLDRGPSNQPSSSQIEKRTPQGAQQQDRSKSQTPAASQERKGTTGAGQSERRENQQGDKSSQQGERSKQGERSNPQGERSKQEPRSGASQRSNERSTTGQSRSREETERTRSREESDRMDRRDDRMNSDRNTRDRDTSRAREESSPTGRSERDDRAGTRQDRSSTSVRLNSEQRSRIVDVISRQNVRSQTNINVDLRVGARLPRSVRLNPVPREVVSIYPEFRNYRYTVVRDEIVIVDPQSYEVVEVIPRSGRATTGRAPSGDRTRISIPAEKRRVIRETLIRDQSVARCEDVRVEVGAEVSRTIRFTPFPEVVVREVPEIRDYRYCIHGDDVVLIDPEEYRIVEVID